MRTRVQNNSAAILDAMINKGLSACEAAQAVGVHVDTLTYLLKADRPIHYKTAAKLKKAFGENSVTILPPAQIYSE